VCVLKLQRETLCAAGLFERVLRRTLHVLNLPEYPALAKFAKTAPNLRTAEHMEMARKVFRRMPFFINFHRSEKGPQKVFEVLLSHLVIEAELTQTGVLWHEGSSMDHERFSVRIILREEVRHYCKGSRVDPLQLSSIDWEIATSIASVVGKESAAVAMVGNVIGGPSEMSQTLAEETLVGLKGCIFATITKQLCVSLSLLSNTRRSNILWMRQQLRGADHSTC